MTALDEADAMKANSRLIYNYMSLTHFSVKNLVVVVS